MSDKTLMVYIGTAEDALHDFMQAWKTGKPAHPSSRLSFESMTGFSKTAINAFNRSTRKGADMQPYQQLLAKAIDSIAGKSQETGVLSLFSRGGTVLAPGESQGIEDFEVVSYVLLP